jgi:hypothetical protein
MFNSFGAFNNGGFQNNRNDDFRHGRDNYYGRNWGSEMNYNTNKGFG